MDRAVNGPFFTAQEVREYMSLLKMEGIVKAFNGVPVLKGVRLNVEKGEVHALLGENGPENLL